MTPDGEHRVLQDLLAKGSIAADDEEDLAQHDLAVSPVELGQGALVASGNSPEELGIVPVLVGRDGTHRADRLVYTVH